jgi:hypothetical protein
MPDVKFVTTPKSTIKSKTVEVKVDDLEEIYNLVKQLTPVATRCISTGNATGVQDDVKLICRKLQKLMR